MSESMLTLNPQALRNLDLGDFFNRQTEEKRQKYIKARQKHMNILKRCHFQLTGRSKFDDLVALLREYVDGLLKICSEGQADVCFVFDRSDLELD